MAKNTYSSNLVAAYDTFAAWLDRTNQISSDMYNYVVTTSNTSAPGLTSGNAFINGSFGANIVYVTTTLQGGTGNTPGTLNIVSNTNITNTFSVGSTSNVVITGTTVTFVTVSGNASINSTSYTGTAANASLLGGSSLSTVQGQITGNAATAYTNSINYVSNGVTNGSIVAANATFAANTLAVGGITVNTASPLDGYVLAYDGGTSKIVFKNPSNISVALNANVVTANLQLLVGSNGSGYAANIYGNSSVTAVSFKANTITLQVDSGSVNINSSANVNGTLSVGNVVVNATSISIGNATVNASITSNSTVTSFSGTSNNSNYFGGLTLGTVQSQITGNSDTAFANAIANAASNAAGIYQTMAGLSANVATLAANAATYLGNSSGTIANVASWITGNAAAAYSNAATYASNGSNISTGTVAPARLGSGTPDNTTILYGNGVWASAGALGVNTSAQFNWSNVHTFGANVTFAGNATAIVTVGNSTVNAAINSTAIVIGNATISATISSNSTVTSFSGTSNNSIYLGGTTLATIQGQITGNAATAYTNATTYASNATNISTGTLAAARLPATTVNTSGAFTIAGVLNHTANLVVTGNTTAVLSVGNNSTSNIIANATTLVVQGTATVGSVTSNSTVISVGNATISTTINATSFSGTANNATNLGGTAAAGYQTTAGLSANVATLTANNATNLGGTAAAGYQTTAGLSANVATLTANAATYLGNSATTGANVASWISGNAATAYSNGTSYADTKAATAYSNATTYASNATNIGSGTLSAARLPSTIVNTSAAFTLSGVQTFNANVVVAGNTTAVITLGSGAANVTVNSTAALVSTNSTVYTSITPTTITSLTGSVGIGTAASGNQGEIRASNNITAYYTSDIRLKEDIVPIVDPLYKIALISGVNFNWTDQYILDSGGEDGYFVRKEDVGVIAQEIQTVLPEAVAERGDGYLAVRYEKIIPLLIEAIKELQHRVLVLEKLNDITS